MGQVTRLFWEKGFQGTSVQDLVKTTGLNKGSLYSCLGNKQEIFELALDTYLTKGPLSTRKKESPLEALVDFYSRAISDAYLPASQRRGCLIFNSCLEFGNKPAKLTPLVLKICRTRQTYFEGLIVEAQKKGELSSELNQKKAGQRIFAAAFTIREMSKFLPDPEFLCEVANSALASLGTSQRVVLDA